MTPIAVGSTGTSGAATGTRSAPSTNDAAPQGFDLLLAGAHSARDTGQDPVRQLSRDSTHDDRRESNPPDTPNATDGTTRKTDRRGNADTVDKTGDAGETSDGATPKTDATSDQAALAAAVAALALTPPTPVAPVPDPTAAAVTTADAVPTADATTIDANALLALAAESAATAGLDTTGDSQSITNPITPPVDPKLLPVPNLPTAVVPHADPNDANANALTPTIAAPPSSPPPAAAAPDHPRPPAVTSPTSGAAAFAAAPPANAPAVTNVNIDAGATATAEVAPPPPSEQLVSVLTPMRNTQNGTYTLRLELKPPELGRVEMRVEIRDGVLHASIHAEHEGSGQLLRDALGELRDRLDAGGVQTGALTVSDGSVGSHAGQGGPGAANGGISSTGTADDDLAQAAPALQPTPDSDSEATSLLDVRV